jgi:hypothetical protein
MKCAECGKQTFVRTASSLRLGGNKRLGIELVSCTNCFKADLHVSRDFIEAIVKLQNEVDDLEKKVTKLLSEWKNSPQQVGNYHSINKKPYRDLSTISDELQKAKGTLQSRTRELKKEYNSILETDK